MSLAGIGTALVGFANGILNNSYQQDAARQQAAENEKNRQHNLMLAQMQNEWSKEQWQRENAYNDPVAQRARLKAAGLNPDLVYGNGAQTLSAQSPAMTSGAGSNPSDVSALANRSSPLGQALSAEMMRAQIENVKADSAQKKSQTVGQDISNRYAELFSEQGLELQGAQIKVLGEQVNLSRAQQSEITARIGEIQANTQVLQSRLDEIQSVIEQNKANKEFIKAQTDRINKLVDAEAKQLAANTALSYAEAKEILQLLPYKMGLMNMEQYHHQQAGMVLSGERYMQKYDEKLKSLGIERIGIENNQLQFDLVSDKRFKNFERAVNLVNSISQGYNNIITPFTNMLKIIK